MQDGVYCELLRLIMNVIKTRLAVTIPCTRSGTPDDQIVNFVVIIEMIMKIDEAFSVQLGCMWGQLRYVHCCCVHVMHLNMCMFI